MDNNEKYYTAEEVAELLKVTTESVRRWIRDGKLRSVKLSGKFIRISQTDLDEFIASMRDDSPTPTIRKIGTETGLDKGGTNG
jgi:excisionase family DNA binding protein